MTGLAEIVGPLSFYLEWDCPETGHLPMGPVILHVLPVLLVTFVIAGDRAFISVEFSAKCRST